MLFGNTLKQIREFRGMTQKELGIKMGFKESTADVRIAQYETGTRFPKEDGIKKLAEILDVQESILSVPNIPDKISMMELIMSLDDYPILDLSIDDDGTIRIRVKGMEEHCKQWKKYREESDDNPDGLPDRIYWEWLLNWHRKTVDEICNELLD